MHYREILHKGVLESWANNIALHTGNEILNNCELIDNNND